MTKLTISKVPFEALKLDTWLEMKIAWKVTCLIVLLRCRTPFTPHPVKGSSSAPHTLSHAWLALFLWFSLFIHISEGCALQNGWHFGKVSSSLWSLLWISEDTLTFGRFGIILIMKLFRNIYSCDLTCLSILSIHHYPSVPSHPSYLRRQLCPGVETLLRPQTEMQKISKKYKNAKSSNWCAKM